MSQTVRVYYGGAMSGRTRVNFNWSAINAESAVVITAAEYSPNLVSPGFPNERRRVLGEATVWISNIGVHGGDPTGSDQEAGGVEFHIHVDFPSPIFVVVDITVLDPPASVLHL